MTTENRPFEVLLSSKDIAIALAMAGADMVNDLQTFNPPVWEKTYEETMARVAFFRAIDRFPCLFLGLDTVGIALGIWNPFPSGVFVTKLNAESHDIIVAVQPKCPRYRITGWIRTEDIMEYAANLSDGPHYLVPPESLRPIDELYRAAHKSSFKTQNDTARPVEGAASNH